MYIYCVTFPIDMVRNKIGGREWWRCFSSVLAVLQRGQQVFCNIVFQLPQAKKVKEQAALENAQSFLQVSQIGYN